MYDLTEQMVFEGALVYYRVKLGSTVNSIPTLHAIIKDVMKTAVPELLLYISNTLLENQTVK